MNTIRLPRQTAPVLICAAIVLIAALLIGDPGLYAFQLHTYNERFRPRKDPAKYHNFSWAVQGSGGQSPPLPLKSGWTRLRFRTLKDFSLFMGTDGRRLEIATSDEHPGRTEVSPMVRLAVRPSSVVVVDIDFHDHDRWPVRDLQEVLKWPDLSILIFRGCRDWEEIGAFRCTQPRLSQNVRPIIDEWHAAIVESNDNLTQEREWEFQDRLCEYLGGRCNSPVYLPRPESYVRPVRTVPDPIRDEGCL